MSQEDLVLETRKVRDFDQVYLRGNLCCAELFIEQGEAEKLTIEAESQVARRIETVVREGRLTIRLGGSWLEKLGDLITNDLTRPTAVFRLGVRQIRGLDLYAAAYIHASSIETDSLRLNWRGAGHLVIESLRAQKLVIAHSGAGTAEIAGRVQGQLVNLSGVGRYDGSRLLTERTEVQASGASFACVHASDTLKVVVRGVGVVEYAGDPQVRTRVTGTGSVVRVG
jgi:hypothetical protein